MMYYQVYLEKNRGLYTYVDEKEEYRIGDSVFVSFRNQKQVAYIIALDSRQEFPFRVLPILAKTDFPNIPPLLVQLARWMVRYYVSSYEAVLRNMIPRDLKIKKKIFYSLHSPASSEYPQKLLEYFREYSSVSRATLRKYLSLEEIKQGMGQQYLIEFEKNRFAWNLEKEKIGKIGKYFLQREQILAKKLEEKFSKAEIQEFLEKNYLEEKNLFETGVSSLHSFRQETSFREIELNEEQRKATFSIMQGKASFYLLKGVTGSGKTEVYLSLIRKAFQEGKGSIFLVPEISLTPQMVERFQGEFQENIAILHSRLSSKERAEEWIQLYHGKKKIVLGVRSAIFAPVQNLQYIIIDEEHESSYKQDVNPKYHARQVALKRAMLEGVKLILGSATPSIESYYYAKHGIYQLLELNQRYNQAKMPDIELVDMKEERDLFFSQRLLEEIRNTLLRKEQILLLLNRKGYSTYIQCQDCGHVEECNHCSIKMSYYASKRIYKCNYCGKVIKYTGRCSVCGSEHLVHSGKGIERVEEELKQYFPDISILRVDGDQKGKQFFEQAYYDFLQGKYQVMIGTQLIAKGLHFPNVTLVGVINADMILNFPDFRAGEKTYQLLAQVAGRAGREEKPGKVIIQTYQSEHYVIEKVREHDYEGFYEKEIEAREFLDYPPFSKMILIGLSSKNEEYLKQKAEEIFQMIPKDEADMYGPMPCLVYRVKDRYRYQIFMKGSRDNIEKYKKILRKVLSKYQTEEEIRISMDAEPLNMI
ncbi:primosomal protein N' [Fusobacterium necrophorum]|nr:primosomal protein N' [Fusobacterium necrophorum]KDE74981.1 primosomal protein [Fusobacterium necrophorum BFTR-2]MBR8733902.1 primosomal protein N' [Fusobacterium necrophorum]MBR8790049.1 primosomal protein N' [Fusobacterium necrophorum]